MAHWIAPGRSPFDCASHRELGMPRSITQRCVSKPDPQNTCWTSSTTSKNASLGMSTFRRPRPRTSVLRSSGFRNVSWLAIWAARSCPSVSRCSPPPPSSVLGVRWVEGRAPRPVEGRAMSTSAGDGAERGTWTLTFNQHSVLNRLRIKFHKPIVTGSPLERE